MSVSPRRHARKKGEPLKSNCPRNTLNTRKRKIRPAKYAKGRERKNRKERREQKVAREELIFKDEAYAIMGACFAVYRDKGCGFLEAVYQECLEIEFEYCNIPAKAKQPLLLNYRGRTLRQVYQPDFICHENIIMEIKAISALADEHRAQVLNYLSATDFQLGLLVNFGHYPKIEYERLANTSRRQKQRIARQTH